MSNPAAVQAYTSVVCRIKRTYFMLNLPGPRTLAYQENRNCDQEPGGSQRGEVRSGVYAGAEVIKQAGQAPGTRLPSELGRWRGEIPLHTDCKGTGEMCGCICNTVLKPVPGSGSRANFAQFHGSSDVKHVSSWFQPWATLWPTCHMLVPASFLLNV